MLEPNWLPINANTRRIDMIIRSVVKLVSSMKAHSAPMSIKMFRKNNKVSIEKTIIRSRTSSLYIIVTALSGCWITYSNYKCRHPIQPKFSFTN